MIGIQPNGCATGFVVGSRQFTRISGSTKGCTIMQQGVKTFVRNQDKKKSQEWGIWSVAAYSLAATRACW
jgi:hypothetical protein